MRTYFFIILFFMVGVIEARCPQRNARVQGAFDLVEAGGNLAHYLSQNLVAKQAVNDKCETLYLASIRAQNEVIRKYLESVHYHENLCFAYAKPVDLGMGVFTQPDSEFVTPYIHAVKYGNVSTVAEFRADIHKSFCIEGWGATFPGLDDSLTMAAGTNNKYMLQYLLDLGVSVNYAPSSGWSAFMRASQSNSLEVVKFLVEKGANVQAKSWTGTIALDAAQRYNTADVVDYLKSLGIKPSTYFGELPVP